MTPAQPTPMSDVRRLALSAAGWCLGLVVVVASEGCAGLPPVEPPTAECAEATLAASMLCPAGDSRSPECFDAALRAAGTCRLRPVTDRS